MKERFRLDFDVAGSQLPMLFGLMTPHLIDPARAAAVELFTVNPGPATCSVIIVTTSEDVVGEVGQWYSSGHLLAAANFIEQNVRLLPPHQARPMPMQVTSIPITVPSFGTCLGGRP